MLAIVAAILKVEEEHFVVARHIIKRIVNTLEIVRDLSTCRYYKIAFWMRNVERVLSVGHHMPPCDAHMESVERMHLVSCRIIVRTSW